MIKFNKSIYLKNKKVVKGSFDIKLMKENRNIFYLLTFNGYISDLVFNSKYECHTMDL